MKSEAESAKKLLEKQRDAPDADPAVKAAASKAIEMIEEKFTETDPQKPGKKVSKGRDKFGEDRDK